jgi:nitrogen regulatory protein PII
MLSPAKALANKATLGQSAHGTQKTIERDPMKQVTAIIKPFRLNEVRDALNAIGVSGLTVTQVQGYGRQRGQGAVYRGPEYEVKFIPKLKIEVLVASQHAEKVFETILKEARTGQLGDGKIFIQDVEKVARIRTGEFDSDAI